MYQRTEASDASAPNSSPISPWSGKAAWSRSRIDLFDRLVGLGHEAAVGLGLDDEVAPKVSPGDDVGLVAGGHGDVEPATQLGVGAAPERCRPVAPERRVVRRGHRADPRTFRVPEWLANDLEADPLPKDVDLTARSERAVGGRYAYAIERSTAKP